jgi:predicted TIM-barrel fold metal-dependent hydrolase
MQPGSFTPSELFTHTVPAGVGRIVLIQMSYYGFDNRYLLAALARYPGVFSAVAVVDEQAPGLEATLRELVRQGVRGVRVQPSRGKETDPARFFASPGMTALWRCAAAERLAVCLLVNPGELPAVADVCAKFPDTPVVIDHFGRVGIDGTMREADLQNLCALGRHAQVRVKVSAFYALGRKQPPYTDLVPMIRRVLDAFGPQRLMWASDAPFQVLPPHTYQASLDLVRQRLDFLSPGDRHWLLRKTAEQTYFG